MIHGAPLDNIRNASLRNFASFNAPSTNELIVKLLVCLMIWIHE